MLVCPCLLHCHHHHHHLTKNMDKYVKYFGYRDMQTFHSQDLVNNSPYCLPYNSHDVSLKNFVLDQLIILSLTFFFIVVTYLLDIVLIL